MKIRHNGTLMRIYFSQSRHRGDTAMYRLVVEALAGAGIAGASAFLGIGGFGRGRYISRADVVDAFVDLPILIEVVDDDAKIRGFIPTLESLLDDGLVTLERVQTSTYRAG